MGPFDIQGYGSTLYTPQSVKTYTTNNPQIVTNVEFVTSLEEALYKSNTRNSDIIYLDQNKPVIYRIKVDFNGVKSYAVLPYTIPDQANSTPAMKSEVQQLGTLISELTERINTLEQARASKPKKMKAEEVGIDEPNG